MQQVINVFCILDNNPFVWADECLKSENFVPRITADASLASFQHRR
jgi:hypothetical protein